MAANARFQTPDGRWVEIRDVWADNLEREMCEIRRLIKTHPYVAMDTEFPGVVARPVGTFTTTSQYQYQTLRCNVDLLKIIQLGVSFADENGRLADGCPTFQFNFKFELSKDMYAQDSIELLRRSGIDFARHERDGIEVCDFGEMFLSSGLALNPWVRWISFHSGYDFGYLLKVLTDNTLPDNEDDFFTLLSAYFPCIFDVKHIMNVFEGYSGGLNKLADDLGIQRLGPMHQAGSDSMLTSDVFFALRARFTAAAIDTDRFKGVLYGLGPGALDM